LQFFNGVKNAMRKGDVPKLRELRRVLGADEMDELSSSLIMDIGYPTGGMRGISEEMKFSAARFATRWNEISRNREVVNLAFPNKAHSQALDDLARVTSRLANVDAKLNVSGSGNVAVGLGGLGAVGAAVYTGYGLEAALGALGAYGGTSVLLSRPVLTRWLAGYMRIRAAAGRNPGANPDLQEHIARLGALAAKGVVSKELHKIVEQDNQ
jgi:hypothetical protein